MSKHAIKEFLDHKAYNLRVNSLIMTSIAASGHPTSCLSAADLVSALFFYAMRYDPKNFNNPNNDRFILSKGHASPLLYAAWKEVGVITQDDLLTYRKISSNLEGHPTLRFPYAEAATGSLGMGLSIGAGMAKSAKMDNRDFYTYVVLGDSEIAEGSIWEAAEIAAHYKLNNLIALLDCNRLGQSTAAFHEHHVQRYAQQFEAFGWKTIVVDGHDMQEIMGALDKARSHENRPTIILAKTFKGYGVDVAQNKEGFHGKPFKKEELTEVLQKLDERFPKAAEYNGEYQWAPTIPKGDAKVACGGCVATGMKESPYSQTDSVAALGHACDSVVSLDAEVKNSTYAEIFEDAFPERFIQCFIAEQNMVSMGVGLERRCKVPFISTFGAFFSRAYDQIRMAAVGSSNLRLVGSHAGISIGEDGPSQMALEDIALMRALPGSIVLYPSDAVSTYKLVGQMAEYNQGISYLRTTRMATSVLYGNSEEFPVGGCKVLRQSDKDIACIVGAGITLHEALKAYDLLQQKGISIAVIDLYSIKPLDTATLAKIGKAAGNKIITVEDHYLEGGLGQAVAYALRNSGIKIECLAVTELPRSGKPEELLAAAGIDAAAIMKAVK
jgi:transketolase